MLDTLLWLIIGAFIGWNLPQPEYAKRLQEYVVNIMRKIMTKDQ